MSQVNACLQPLNDVIPRFVNNLPVEPVQKSKEEEDEEAELRALQAEMAIWLYYLRWLP
jgi:hypothetical protein